VKSIKTGSSEPTNSSKVPVIVLNCFTEFILRFFLGFGSLPASKMID